MVNDIIDYYEIQVDGLGAVQRETNFNKANRAFKRIAKEYPNNFVTLEHKAEPKNTLLGQWLAKGGK